MIRTCPLRSPARPPGRHPHWLPSRNPEPGPDVQAVALCGCDPVILRCERTSGGWRSDGAAALYPDHTPPKPWELVGRCWDGREHPICDVTTLLYHA